MISVLVVEDDPIAAEAHRRYVDRVSGFHTVAVAHSGAEARRALDRETVDLIVLDLYLPDVHGLDFCRALRAAGLIVDVLVVTAVRDLTVVRAAVSIGVVQYLLKPFTFPGLRDKLERYAKFRNAVDGAGAVRGQAEVDQAFGVLRSADRPQLPTGMSETTLSAINQALTDAGGSLTATGTASATGVSRVTARRYLEYLADNGFAEREHRYGQVGRPEVWYRVNG
ncbi:response regulator of citrate/malate metabolism [Tamaricihabitans halophyticus]|uniref:Transcriptional regulatory protein n=1 Tax=Tamaricihabitans halophyticus TaxID=1262583 RepID=A0A4R2QCR6_9PSEU|nr:response regulator [Tamaricihabitans halophyticus]TCP44751.1 response regulator of citrate/malate metabolism [Tamaricihabitans halophyticus]